MSIRANAAGSATSAGILFQSRVAAWFAARVLLEVPPAQDLPHLGTYIRCETEQPVDDIIVALKNGGAIYIQVKRSVSASFVRDSPLGSAFAQFVGQYIACRGAPPGSLPWERPLEPSRDRLLLVVGPRSTRTVTVGLAQLLARLRGTPLGIPLRTALRTKADKDGWRKLRACIVEAWRRVQPLAPSDADILQFIQLVRIQVLDVDEGGADELVAQDLVASIVRERQQVGTAWRLLIAACTRLASERAGADSSQLLLELGSVAKAPPSIESDIDALKKFTCTSLERLEELSHLRIGSRKIKQARTSAPALLLAANDPLLLIGEPGAGKSGALHHLAHSLVRRGADVLVVAADAISATTAASLRADLGISHDLEDVLARWPGDASAYLIIDALDAVRGTAGSRLLRDVIARVMSKCPRWRVVASIRKFDARYSPQLHSLFRGLPPTREYSDPDPCLRNIRHFALPNFSEAELSELGGMSPEIEALLKASTPSLRELLHNPFNLRIACELVSEGPGAAELASITSGVGLLDSYWLHRVLTLPGADARESVLRVACERMLEARQLRVERRVLADRGGATFLEQLLTTHVLSEWQPTAGVSAERYSVTFSHHVLFDYAASRLVVTEDTGRAIELLSKDPELALAARPSVAMFFRRHWFASQDRAGFWAAALRFSASRLTFIAKLIAPGIAAEATGSATDLEPLLAAIRHHHGDDDSAERTLTYVVAAVVDRGSSEQHARIDFACWSSILDQATTQCTRSLAYAVRPLLVEAVRRRDWTSSALDALGRVSRRLLAVAWAVPERDRFLVSHGLSFVSATFESAPSESAALLRRAFTQEHLHSFGHEELFALAQEVAFLADKDPALVGDLYMAAFTYRQSSRDTTSLGNSQILALTSTKAQDYELALYTLSEAFPRLLHAAPDVATRVLIVALDFYIRTDQRADTRQFEEHAFAFDGAEASIRCDLSEIWDSSDTYSHDEPMKLLAVFDAYVRELAAGDEAQQECLRSILRILTRENAWAVLWRRMLIWARAFPVAIGMHVRTLLWTRCILLGTDTTHAVGEALKVVFQALHPNERNYVERAILTLPDESPPERKEGAEHLRDRLLGCLADDALTSVDAREAKRRLVEAGSVPPNRPFIQRSHGWSRPYGPREYLTDAGVPVDEPQNRRLQELDDALSALTAKYFSQKPDRQDLTGLVQGISELRSALSRAEQECVHPKQSDHGYTTLVTAAAHASKADHVASHPGAASLLKSLLVEASTSRYPELADADVEFLSPGWGPAPRIEAAAGIMDLAFEPELYDPPLRTAIVTLAHDPVPAVRFQVARRLSHLDGVDRTLFQQLVEHFALKEPTPGVLLGLIGGGLEPLARSDAPSAVPLAIALLQRLRGMPKDGAKEALDHCLTVLLMLDVWRGDLVARSSIDETLQGVPETGSEVLRMLGHLRDSLTVGPLSPKDPEADAARRRAFGIYERALEPAAAFLKGHVGLGLAMGEPDAILVRASIHIFDSVAHQIYFAAGGASDGEQTLGPEGLKRLYGECTHILDLVASGGVPSATHYLLKSLELFIPIDPTGVFRRISLAVVSAEGFGYQFESLAAELAVTLVQRFIADYLGLLRGDPESRMALLAILEVFAKAGWPSARQLTFGLQEMYR